MNHGPMADDFPFCILHTTKSQHFGYCVSYFRKIAREQVCLGGPYILCKKKCYARFVCACCMRWMTTNF